MVQLRNINSKEVLSSGSLRNLIRAQLQDDIVSETEYRGGSRSWQGEGHKQGKL